ncbi:uncharacterized protein east isoform X2 [Chelonus insularis]|uniref:uncharacterized protein east isoform X2 n=1 Tax=Chelonus insularis TaxID=460826 RepID=UPI00158C54D5|nr:uncharacterized protein LOC118074213 isoform X2 [Chelonus insularis]
MASREKKPLASSKSKQKANNDSGLSSSPNKSKKGKTLPAYILEAVATGSTKLSSKLEPTLPRKKLTASLKCKKKLKAAKANLIQVKSTNNVPVKNLKRLTTPASGKSTKGNLNRTKKTKPVAKAVGEQEECVPSIDKNTESLISHIKNSPKPMKTFLYRGGFKIITQVPTKRSAKATKLPGGKKTVGKESLEGDLTYLKNRKTSPSSEVKWLRAKNSVDSTIDDVLAMLGDSELVEFSGDTEKLEGKVTRSKKVLMDENEIKKEVTEVEEEKSDEESVDTSSESQGSNSVKKRTSQRSLRNGKLRQLESAGEGEKKNRRLNAEDTVSETIDDEELCESSSSEQSLNMKDESGENLDVAMEITVESEKNNNSEQADKSVDRGEDAGPNLRSKAKAKSTDTQIKIEDNELEDTTKVAVVKNLEEPKKSSSLDHMRKDSLLAKLTSDKQPIKRRSSLNIDVKKTMGSLYGNEKTDGTAPKSQIDQMIESIKLTIAKSIESKIFGPGKSLTLGKSYDIPEIEEIVAPLSTETQKISLEENEKDEPNVSKNESTSSNTSSENSVPKVADTAKEIEKLVMGEIELETKNAESTDTSKDEVSNKKETANITNEKISPSEADAEKLLNCTSSKEMCIDEEKDYFNEKENTSDEPFNLLASLDESETLETISKEVERLVAEPDNTVNKNDKAEEEDNEIQSSNSQNKEINNFDSTFENSSDIKEDLNNDKKSRNSPESISDENLKKIDKVEDTKIEKVNKSDLTDHPESSSIEKSDKTSPKKINQEEEIKPTDEKKNNGEESKSPNEESKRVLRTRDKQKKAEKVSKTIELNDGVNKVEENNSKADNIEDTTEIKETKSNKDESDSVVVKIEEPEPQTRTRRSREVKKRKEETSPSQTSLKSKRNRRDTRKSDQQKEETLLDNEVATINEKKRSFSVDKLSKRLDSTKSLRAFSPGNVNNKDNRSKSENDIESSQGKTDRLSRDQCGSDKPKESENPETHSDAESKSNNKISENFLKDSDEASTSGESTSSVSLKILETPEDKERKESILRLLGLESLEKAAERLHYQKIKREQYTGTLKTIIRVNKDKDKEKEKEKDKDRDKKQSRSPLKMVLKQGRSDGDGDSPEFYTIQKELGTSGSGDSSSDELQTQLEMNRPRLIIPEKSSSFSIHPGRLCADVCCYCFGKFGSLDTPMHLAQLKSDERRRKILNIERHLTKDSCLCDACYRHVDRKANMSPTNSGSKPQRVHRQLLVSKCYVKNCRGPARHLVKRRWLHKIKPCIQNRVNIDINWEPSQHTSMSFCVDHYAIIERFLTCSLCTRRLARNATHQLPAAETEQLNHLLEQQGIPIPLEGGTFVCKLCRYFTQIQLRYRNIENMNTNHKVFTKSYRKRILHYNDIEVSGDEDDEESQSISNKDKRKKSKGSESKNKSSSSKSPDENSTSEKSTPEPMKLESVMSGAETETRELPKTSVTNEENTSTEPQILDLESTVEKLKKRKALDQHLYSTDSPVFSDNGGDVVEILAMDKEVTLTRLPKRPRLNNDITPVVQRLGANPSISVRTLFPGEEEMGLHANIEFSNVREVTPQGWEKCATIIQYDRDTKLLWQELQRPYGNQSSFLRHLILLEKYYRSGDLVLAPNASRNAINYSTSVQNRLISYEGPEKMDEPITEPLSTEYSNSRRLSGGFVMERDRLSTPSTSTLITTSPVTATQTKSTGNQLNTKQNPPKVLKINSGVSIIKKPPPNLQRLNLPSSSGNVTATNGSAKRKDGFPSKITSTGNTSGGKVFQLTEPDFQRLKNLKKQKMLNEKITSSTVTNSTAVTNMNTTFQYQKAQLSQTQFQKHLRMQQEMLNRQSRGDFEPLICDVRSLVNENTPAQNLLNNLNLPKSIQVTTKPSTLPIPILPKIPKSLTVIPQTVSRPVDK